MGYKLSDGGCAKLSLEDDRNGSAQRETGVSQALDFALGTTIAAYV
jgi:hypothetical protein